jgi:ATP-dependent DNA helicase RecG
MRYGASDSVRLIPGVGPKTAESLRLMGLATIGHLLNWFPRRYIDATNPLPLNLVPYGVQAAVRVTVVKSVKKQAKSRRLSYLDVVTADDSKLQLTLRFFHQPYMEQKLKPGTSWTCVGTIKRFNGEAIMIAPLILEEPHLIPVYLQSKSVSTWVVSRAVRQVLPQTQVDELLPTELREAHRLPVQHDILRHIHMPQSMAEAEQGRQWVAFLEAFSFFMDVEQSRTFQAAQTGSVIAVPVDWLKQLVTSLPFALTSGQKRIIWDALQELSSGALMTRLINGDVGSGKTAVAAVLAACVVRSGKKVAVLAPTELLAQQHAATFQKLLGTNYRTALWTASSKGSLAEAEIVIGTHALLQEGVELENLGLVVVDEQHRFGVKQRSALRDTRQHPPHVLSMTATPIPRTLALVLFADLQVSFLKEKPANRLPVRTALVMPGRRSDMEDRIRQEVAAGRQAFVLCPLITKEEALFDEEPDATRDLKTVEKEVARLQKEHPEFGVVKALHGKMKAKEKEALMNDFRENKVQVLVATSVIEVGVDVPNATVMVVENAERFGLAQLHQLRGRVGRGNQQAFCYLCPTIGGGPAIDRLRVLVEHNDGFEVAEHDLALRGPGDITGTVQAGLPDFKMASLTDLEFLQKVRDIVRDYCAEHPAFVDEWRERAQRLQVGGLA